MHLYPLIVEAKFSENAERPLIGNQIKVALAGICGAPDSQDIKWSVFSDEVKFSLHYYRESEIPEIRRRLDACPGLNPKTIKIIETKVIYH